MSIGKTNEGTPIDGRARIEDYCNGDFINIINTDILRNAGQKILKYDDV